MSFNWRLVFSALGLVVCLPLLAAAANNRRKHTQRNRLTKPCEATSSQDAMGNLSDQSDMFQTKQGAAKPACKP